MEKIRFRDLSVMLKLAIIGGYYGTAMLILLIAASIYVVLFPG